MPENPNQNGHFEPIHDAHALEQVAFVFQVDHPIDDARYLEVRGAAAGVATDLPGRAELQGFKLSVGAQGALGLGPSMGNQFSRTRPDGAVEGELRIDRTSATFRTMIYTRWEEVWAKARSYFDAIVPRYLGPGRISGISLNFVDKFVWTGAPAACRPSLLLRPGSRYVCPHVYEVDDLWHSHTGAFLRADRQTKRLLNINIDYLDENLPTGSRRIVVVTTVLTDLMNQAGFDPLEVGETALLGVFDDHMQQLHAFGKMAFGNIINDEMSRRIALTD